MEPFTLPETRRTGAESTNPLAAAAVGRSGRTTGREASRGDAAPSANQEIVLGSEEMEAAPDLTMISSRHGRGKKEAKGWQFWKRPSRRQREQAALRERYEELQETMGAVRDHLEKAGTDRLKMNKTLAPLPLAVDGLRMVGDNQRRTHQILEGLQECVERTQEKDAVFFKAMDRLNDGMSTMDHVVVGMGRTFSSIERTSRASTATLTKLSERLEASDRFLEVAFEKIRATETEFSQVVSANARRSAIVTVVVCALMTLGIAVLAFTISRIAGVPGGLPAAGGTPALMSGAEPASGTPGAGDGAAAAGLPPLAEAGE